MKVCLSLGSNLGDRLANLERALELLAAGGCRIVKRSPVYETEPLYYCLLYTSPSPRDRG